MCTDKFIHRIQLTYLHKVQTKQQCNAKETKKIQGEAQLARDHAS